MLRLSARLVFGAVWTIAVFVVVDRSPGVGGLRLEASSWVEVGSSGTLVASRSQCCLPWCRMTVGASGASSAGLS
jgi:hypothetical protein